MNKYFISIKNFLVKNLYIYITIWLTCIIYITGKWITKTFGNVGFEAIYFTINNLNNIVPKNIIHSYGTKLCQSVVISVILIIIFQLLLKFIKNLKVKKIIYLFVPLILLISSIIYVLKPYYSLLKIEFTDTYSNFFDQNYVAKSNYQLITNNKQKNCIVLVLESMENTFYNKDLNLSLIPKLNRLSDENISFKNLIPIFGTGYSIAAVTGHLFGIPLRIPIDGNRYTNLFKFLPNATSVIEVLDKNNYNISFIIGSNATFSGLDKLFMSHSNNSKIFDEKYFLNIQNKKFISNDWWGIEDRIMYEKSKKIILDLSKQQKPFFTVLMTIDTHAPAKVYDYYPHIYNDSRDAFVEADRLAIEFIDWLKQQDFYNDTVVIILGDHLFMSKKIANIQIPPDFKRTIYNTFLNTNKKVSDSKKLQLCSAMDIAPTILESLNFILPENKFGLGVSLFSDQQTLLETYGAKHLNEELSKRSVLYDSFF
jgi:phosphoglycerol transferase